jgi:hypothetical protein
MASYTDESSGQNAVQMTHQQRSQHRFRWLKMGLLNVVFLIAPFCVWYYMHVENSLETHTISAFRALNEVDTAFTEQVANLPKIWESSSLISPISKQLAETPSYREKCTEKLSEPADSDSAMDQETRLEHCYAVNEGPYLEEILHKAQSIPAEPGRLPYRQAIGFNPALKNIQFPTERITPGILDACIEHDKKRILIDRVLGDYWAQGVCIEPDDESGYPGPVSTLVQVPLEDLLGSVVDDVSARFDHVMLADDRGRIVSQVNTREVADTKTTGAIATDPFRYDYFNYSNLKSILEDSEDCAEEAVRLEQAEVAADLQSSKPLPHAITCHIRVGQTRFVLYIQPSELDVRRRTGARVVKTAKTDTGTETNTASTQAQGNIRSQRKSNEVDASNIPGESARWFVIGVVRDSSQLGQAFIAPITVTGPVLVLIIIALATLPLLWLSTKSRRAQLTTTHFAFALGGGIIILALSAVLAMHMLFARNIDLQVDESLERLNQAISTDFAAELDQRVDTLAQAWKQSKDCEVNTPWNSTAFPPYEARMVLGRRSGVSNERQDRGIPANDIDSYLHYAPKTGRYENRDYYREVVNGRSWQLNSAEPGSRFYLQRIRSFVDGFKVTALSIPLPADAGNPEPVESCEAVNGVTPEVLVEVQPMLSLAMAAVPVHHGFAVVENGSGRVLFHSSDQRSLDENLIDETDGDLHLISVLQSRNEALLDLNYHGRGIRAFAKPMQSVPWTLLTFVDDEILDTVLLEALITSAGLVVSFAVILIIFVWFYARFFERRSAHHALGWLWPTKLHSHLYPVMIVGVVMFSVLLIAMSITETAEHSAIHLLYFVSPLVVLLMLRFVFPDILFRGPANAWKGESGHDRRMQWIGGILLILLFLMYVYLYTLVVHSAAALVLCAAFALIVLGVLWRSRVLEKRDRLDVTSRHSPAGQDGASEGHAVFEQEYSNLSQFRSLLPLLALLTLAGPVPGGLIYFAAFDAFSDSYSRYSDDQALRALDLREAQKIQAFQRFFTADDAGWKEPVLTLAERGSAAPETPVDNAALDPCRGVYLQPGPFYGSQLDEDLHRSGTGYKSKCPENWIIAHQAREPMSEPRAADNWVHWFVRTLPVFSYESGVIKQQKLNSRDAGRLIWCDAGECGASPAKPVWFVGQLTTRPAFALMWPAADLRYKFMGETGWLANQQLAVISSIVFFLMILALIQYWIARTISDHLFGGRIQQVRLARMQLANLSAHRERALVLISPVRVFERVTEQLKNVLPFTPHNWQKFAGRDHEELAKEHGLTGEFAIVVDETEAIFGIEEQRLTLLRTLEAALERGTRVIMLNRIDPFFWLDMLDSRSLFMSRTLPIKQTEVLLWCSLMRRFSRALVADDLFSELSPMEKGREHAQNWALSTPREKNVLANLAFSDLYNPNNLDVIRHLIQRGLVTNSIPHRLRYEGFRRYIRGSIELPALGDWRREGGDSVWSAIFPTLLVIIGLLLFFVVSAGQNTVKTAMAMIGTVIAALPVLMSAVAFMRSGRSS